MGLYFKAVIYGNSVKVTANQYAAINKIAEEYALRLGIYKKPDIFICNSNGLVNATAITFYKKKYVLLMSSLVDLMLSNKEHDELAMIIGHELGHHAAGHNNFWRNVFLRPSNIIPFLSAAYSRACELTADRIGFELTNNLQASQNALVALALGSERLSQSSNITEFMVQENEIPEFMGFIYKIYSSHPRMTKRVIEITTYNNRRMI
jgi:Zn-dependent protease with chaperone function